MSKIRSEHISWPTSHLGDETYAGLTQADSGFVAGLPRAAALEILLASQEHEPARLMSACESVDWTCVSEADRALFMTRAFMAAMNDESLRQATASFMHGGIARRCDDAWAVCQFLLRSGADINAKDAEGKCAVHKAVVYDYQRVTLLPNLIRAGCEVDAVNAKGETALRIAAERGYPAAMRVLLRAGADPNHRANNLGPIIDVPMYASNESRRDWMLIAYGAKPTEDCFWSTDKLFATPEQAAIQAGDAELLFERLNINPEESLKAIPRLRLYVQARLKDCPEIQSDVQAVLDTFSAKAMIASVAKLKPRQEPANGIDAYALAAQHDDSTGNSYSADDFEWQSTDVRVADLVGLVGGMQQVRSAVASRAIDPAKSDLSRPIVLAKDPEIGMDLWDGVHRLTSAAALGVETIPAVLGSYRWGDELEPIRWRNARTPKP